MGCCGHAGLFAGRTFRRAVCWRLAWAPRCVSCRTSAPGRVCMAHGYSNDVAIPRLHRATLRRGFTCGAHLSAAAHAFDDRPGTQRLLGVARPHTKQWPGLNRHECAMRRSTPRSGLTTGVAQRKAPAAPAIHDSQLASQRTPPCMRLRREQLQGCNPRASPTRLASRTRKARCRALCPEQTGQVARTRRAFAHFRAEPPAAVTNPRKTTVYTSRFVRVILAQGPC